MNETVGTTLRTQRQKKRMGLAEGMLRARKRHRT